MPAVVLRIECPPHTCTMRIHDCVHVYSIPGWKWPTYDSDEINTAISLSIWIAYVSTLPPWIECPFNLQHTHMQREGKRHELAQCTWYMHYTYIFIGGFHPSYEPGVHARQPSH